MVLEMKCLISALTSLV